MFSFFIGSFISSLGVITGNSVFSQKFLVFTVGDILKKNQEEILDTTKDSEEGFILAQKYREYETVTVGEKRNFSAGKDPVFLEPREDIIPVSDVKLGDFSKDKEIAEILRKTCQESLDKPYDQKIYEQVKKWCRFYLPEYSREIFKIQFDRGCRFWLVNSSASSDGWFLGEILEGTSTKEKSEFIEKLQKQNISAFF